MPSDKESKSSIMKLGQTSRGASAPEVAAKRPQFKTAKESLEFVSKGGVLPGLVPLHDGMPFVNRVVVKKQLPVYENSNAEADPIAHPSEGPSVPRPAPSRKPQVPPKPPRATGAKVTAVSDEGSEEDETIKRNEEALKKLKLQLMKKFSVEDPSPPSHIAPQVPVNIPTASPTTPANIPTASFQTPTTPANIPTASFQTPATPANIPTASFQTPATPANIPTASLKTPPPFGVPQRSPRVPRSDSESLDFPLLYVDPNTSERSKPVTESAPSSRVVRFSPTNAPVFMGKYLGSVPVSTSLKGLSNNSKLQLAGMCRDIIMGLKIYVICDKIEVGLPDQKDANTQVIIYLDSDRVKLMVPSPSGEGGRKLSTHRLDRIGLAYGFSDGSQTVVYIGHDELTSSRIAVAVVLESETAKAKLVDHILSGSKKHSSAATKA